MVLRKLSCHSSLWPLLCKGLVKVTAPLLALQPFCPPRSNLELLTEPPAQNVFLSSGQVADSRTSGSDPGRIKTILIRCAFCTVPDCVLIKCGLFSTAVLVCTNNSFLCFPKTSEDPCKTKEWLGHMQTSQITHRRQGLWQRFPHHHTSVTWSKRKAAFACCQVMGYTNIINPKCTSSWCSWEHRGMWSWKAIFMVLEFSGGLAAAAPWAGQLWFFSHGKCVGV